MKNIKLLKDRKHIVQTFSTDQLEHLLKQADLRTFTGLRDYTLMLLLLETGIRVNELVGIDLSNVRLKEGGYSHQTLQNVPRKDCSHPKNYEGAIREVYLHSRCYRVFKHICNLCY
ncbi:tyrosine-type recombinase/integrase [Peribacillus sp. NPDC094092]|uniref:tyrosine-type recombinase/integrase n=1 Tax=Peribacillus sp. NPDC094092 TaxID=3390611 RepID=UPI003D02F351